jgi:hypothetical protein
MIENYADLLKLIKEKVQPSPLEHSSIRVLPNTLVTRLCLALSEAETLSESWDNQYKHIAELEALINNHNENCICDSVKCGYDKWPQRQCPTCPADWKIELQQPTKDQS